MPTVVDLKKLHRLYQLPQIIHTYCHPYSTEGPDIRHLILLLQPYYTGRYRVWRILHPDHLEMVFGCFFNYIYEPTYAAGESDPIRFALKNEETTFDAFKVYAIEDLVTKHVRWYMQVTVQNRCKSLDPQLGIYTNSNYFVYLYTDNLIGEPPVDSQVNSTIAFDFVLDFCLYKVAGEKDFFQLLREPGPGAYRRIILRYEGTRDIKPGLIVQDDELP